MWGCLFQSFPLRVLRPELVSASERTQMLHKCGIFNKSHSVMTGKGSFISKIYLKVQTSKGSLSLNKTFISICVIKFSKSRRDTILLCTVIIAHSYFYIRSMFYFNMKNKYLYIPTEIQIHIYILLNIHINM